MNRFADPLPVSGRAAAPPPQDAVGNTGKIYGTQARVVWNLGEVDPRGVCDSVKALSLWRFSAFGRVTITINYGTQGTREIRSLRTPLVMTIPGQFTATATPIDDRGTVCTVTLTPATAGSRSVARRFVSATASALLLASPAALAVSGPGGDHGGGGGGGQNHPVALDEDAVAFIPLTAATLTVSGVAVSVSALQVVPLVAGSVLNSGSGFEEFEA